jgi:ATP-dependent RNA helicase DHX37/DHR1
MREPRVRFNAKARQSSAGGRKKNRKAQAEVVGEVAQDSNAEVILPRTKEQKERDKKDRLQFEVWFPWSFQDVTDVDEMYSS